MSVDEAIAKAATMRPISAVAEKLKIDVAPGSTQFIQYGPWKAKLDPLALHQQNQLECKVEKLDF